VVKSPLTTSVSAGLQFVLRDAGGTGARGMRPWRGFPGLTLENQAMASSIQEAVSTGRALTGPEADFLAHENVEYGLFLDGDLNAHQEALTQLGQVEQQLYSPEVILKYPGSFSPSYFEYWGIPLP
jgi:hypothetical protein